MDTMQDIREKALRETVKTPDRPATIPGGWTKFKFTRLTPRPNDDDQTRVVEHPDWSFLLRPRFALGVQVIKEDGNPGQFVTGRRGGDIEISPINGTMPDGSALAYADREHALWKRFVEFFDPKLEANTVDEFVELFLTPAVKESAVYEGKFMERALLPKDQNPDGDKAVYRTLGGKDKAVVDQKRAQYAADGFDIYNTLEDVRKVKA